MTPGVAVMGCCNIVIFQVTFITAYKYVTQSKYINKRKQTLTIRQSVAVHKVLETVATLLKSP